MVIVPFSLHLVCAHKQLTTCGLLQSYFGSGPLLVPNVALTSAGGG